MNASSVLASTLSARGHDLVFGVMGDGNMFLIDCFVREQGGRYVAAADEAGAVLMASGYAAASGFPGVATVTHGPGLANTATALTSAARDRTPLVLLAGETRGDRPWAAQHMDQAALVASTGASYMSIASPDEGPGVLTSAVSRAVVDRCPVVVGMPAEFALQEVASAEPPTQDHPCLSKVMEPDEDDLDRALGIMASARRPILLAGRGAMQPGLPGALLELADQLGAPVATTLPAKGIFGQCDHDLGVFGTLSSDAATDAILQSDCIVAVGASLNHHTGGGEGHPYLSERAVVHCDVDASSFDQAFRADVQLLADGRSFAAMARSGLQAADIPSSPFRREVVTYLDPVTPVPEVDLTSALLALDAALPPRRRYTIDGGRFAWEAVKRLSPPGPRSWFCSFAGFGAVGNALATAIGVAAAPPDGPSVAVVGDGGLMIGGTSDFITAVREGFDLIVVVCNDGAYGAEVGKLVSHDLGSDGGLFEWPDFAPVADALGGRGYTVRSRGDLDSLPDVVDSRTKPLLIDVKLDPHRSPKQY